MKESGPKLYYVEEVLQHAGKYTAVLLYVPMDMSQKIRDKEDLKRFTTTEIDEDSLEIVSEGHYVYRWGKNEFQSADNDPRVVQIRERYEELKKNLLLPDHNVLSYADVTKLYSYHVNVGHGNHSLIVFEANSDIYIWMVDCSDYDFLLHKYYRKNIDSCLKHIKQKFNIDTLKIKTVMLTHPHYDHYSGIGYYIDNKIIDSDTIFYINTQYKIQSHNFNNLLSKISTLLSMVIEPVISSSNININILYPDTIDKNSKLSYNNMSSVYNIRFDNKSYCIFPGDIEKEGWDLMNVCGYCKDFSEVCLYAISHHGSLNGHILDIVPPNQVCTGKNPCKIISSTTIPVLMGRDKAYNGVYCCKVQKDFKGRIFYSEKDKRGNPASFLEIDLMNLSCTHY